MMIRKTLIYLCCLMASLEAAPKPNIILFVIDDLGYADMSFLPFAAGDVETPGIDRIAKKGMYFSNAYATSPICSPARAGLATGRYQQRWGNNWYGRGGLPVGEKTIAMELKALGYVTKKVGKNHMNNQRGDISHPLKHGFDEFFGFSDHTWDYRQLSHASKNKAAHRGPLERDGEMVEFKNAYTTELFTDEGVEFIERDFGGQPFFLQMSYNAVHHPVYVGHPEYEKKFGLKPFPQYDASKGNYKKDWHSQWGMGKGHDPDLRKRYLATLACLDDGVSKILDSLEAGGLTKNTVVIFISDNGGAPYTLANNGPLKGNKYCEAEGGCRIPFLFSWPGHFEEVGSTGSLVSTMDIYPTLVELAGGQPHAKLDGKSLLPILRGEEQGDNHRFLVLSRGSEHRDFVVRSGDYKLRNCTSGRKFSVGQHYLYQDETGDFLYNLKEDIGEKNNLYSVMPEKVSELRGMYKEWCGDVLGENKK
ncbi:sulfatase [Rubritalea tangerina]|uniref:Sulfatase n=1 Tax=Rubritalea tangerina TaxID=430798 RepID=A0ABW4ZAV7_9BACT